MTVLAHAATPSDRLPWETEFDDDDVAHVIPAFGPRHMLTLACWCHPVIDDDYTERAISHNVAQ